MMGEETLAEATFHPNLRWYRYIQGVGMLVASVVGIALLPVWLVGGWWWSTRYWETLECELGERTLSIAFGIWFRTEKSIPLEQIQDVSVRHGPLLDYLGLTKLKVETAGQGSSQQAAGNLVGVEDPLAFRDRVLQQRQLLSDGRSGTIPARDEEPSRGASVTVASVTAPLGEGHARERPDPGDAGDHTAGADRETAALLAEIRDVLLRIEERLDRPGGP
jgi:putative membrane protein